MAQLSGRCGIQGEATRTCSAVYWFPAAYLGHAGDYGQGNWTTSTSSTTFGAADL